MGWIAEYRTEFTDILALFWRIDIETDSYAGEIKRMQATGDPLEIEHLANTLDILNDPIRGSMANFYVYADSDFQYNVLYSAEDFKHRVSIYYGISNVLYWRGWLVSGDYSEPYDGVSYAVRLSASDGLGSLKNYEYKDGEDYYNGHRLESQIVLDILSNLNITTFTEYINLYEQAMSSTVNDSPFDQVKINVDLFHDRNCYDVLKELLTKYNAIIKCDKGVYIIYRPTELVEDTVYGRIFTGAVTKSSTSFVPLQLINRPGFESELLNINGGNQGFQPPAKKVTIIQDYGYRQSLLDNYDVKGNTYNEDSHSWDNWTGSTVFNSINDWMPDEYDGIALPGSATKANYVFQPFGYYLVDTSDILGFSINYLLYNYYGSSLNSVELYIKIKANNSDKWLYEIDEKELRWQSSEAYITIVTDINEGKNGWFNYSRSLPEGLPVDGPYTIWLYGPYSASTNLIIGCFKDVNFFCTSNQIIFRRRKPKKKWYIPKLSSWYTNAIAITQEYFDTEEIIEKEYIKENATTGPELEKNCILGDISDTNIDNVIEQFNGVLALYDTGSLADAADKFDSEHSNDYFPAIIVTHSGDDIIFTENDGNDFVGTSTIVNSYGDLAGSVVHTQAHISGTKEIDKIVVTGTSGSANITCNGVTETIEYFGSLVASVESFVMMWALEYLANNVVLSSSGVDIFFKEYIAQGGFSGATSIVNLSGTLNGSKYDIQAPSAGTFRIDTITLTGTNGSANITISGIKREVNIDSILTATALWNRRGAVDNKPLLQIVCDEIAMQYSRPKHLLPIPILETDKEDNIPHLNIFGNFVDVLNIYDTEYRTFVMNKGRFIIRDRMWEIDLVEIGIGIIEEGEFHATADSTLITADSTLITADSL